MQQINLYLPEFHPKREIVNAVNSGLVLTILFAGLVTFYISQVYVRNALAENVSRLDRENKSIQEQLASLKRMPVTDDKARLEQKINKMRAAISNRNQVQELASGRSLGNENGFSVYLHALGKYTLDGLFLKEFILSEGGKFAELKGVSKKAEYVPLYISYLQKDKVFSETQFGVLSINRSGRYLEFSSQGSVNKIASASKKKIDQDTR